MTATSDQRVINRAGFYRTGIGGEREFLVLPVAFTRDVCLGFDVRAVTAALLRAGWLTTNDGRHATQKESLPGMGRARCYVFNGRMWEDANHA
jgi:hypothetical protein